MTRARDLDLLIAPPHTRGRKPRLSREEGLAAIRAYRRGVSVADLAAAVGLSRNNFRHYMGTWALLHCKCIDPPA